MKPQDDYRNGDEGASDEDSSGSEAAALEEELSLCDEGLPARALAALNALRKSRQHYDTVLVAGGAEVPAHRAVLAAASPYLLQALPPPAGAAPLAYRLEHVDADALRALVDYAYTGRLRVREPRAARRLYRAAWRLRLEAVRGALAERLLRRASPGDCLRARALPDLPAAPRAALDAYIAQHFGAVCASGALAALPLLRLDMLHGAGEPPAADQALAWLLDHHAPDVDLAELCSRTHLLYVDGAGALRDCGELPASSGDAPELQEYRREAEERGRGGRRPAQPPPAPPPDDLAPPHALQLGERAPRGDSAVLAACRVEGGTLALLVLRGRLVAARVSPRGAAAGGAGEAEGRERRARLARGRSALGAAWLGARLLVCGGYDRARVLRLAELYDPATNQWTPLPDMRVARARFPVASLDDKLYAIGGSDGHTELDSVDVFCDGVWRAETRLPLALSHAAAAVDGARRRLYVIGGWAGGASVRRVLCYSCDAREWSEAPPLSAARSQCGGAHWAGALWALGGCDAWRCLASTETLALGAEGAGGGWAAGPALPTARRSVGAAAWRGSLVAAGGSDGAASLRRTEWLLAGADAWRPGPQLRRPRAGPGLAPLDDALYVVGGYDGKEFLACVECLYEPDGEWTTLCAPPPPGAPLSPAAPASDASLSPAAPASDASLSPAAPASDASLAPVAPASDPSLSPAAAASDASLAPVAPAADPSLSLVAPVSDASLAPEEPAPDKPGGPGAVVAQ